jgi:catechol 2,3-dioxygenase-like lactoylglutathione lyase family enzyme
MKLNPGIVTHRLAESKAFYQRLGFEVVFENDWYVLLHLNGQELAFMQPNLDFQKAIFRREYPGHGVWLTIELDDVDAAFDKAKANGLAIEFEPLDEPWGDRHFAVLDPNGIPVDFVRHTPPEPEAS